MCLLAVGTLQSAVDALPAFGRAMIAPVVGGWMVPGADGAGNLVPASVCSMSKLLAVGALRGRRTGVKLFNPEADAKGKQSVLDSLEGILLSLKGNAGTAS